MNPADTAPTFSRAVESTGREETFAKLSIDDIYLDLFPAYLKDKRAQLLTDLRDAGASKEEIGGELQAFADQHEDLGLDDFIEMIVNRNPGKVRIVQYCYNKANPDAAGRIKLNSAEFTDVLNAVVAPLGITFGPAKQDAPTPDDNAEPKPGQGYGSESVPVHPPHLRPAIPAPKLTGYGT